MLLEVNNVRKVYTTRLSTQSTEALKNVNFAVDNNEYVAIMGESGSGKTTLLNILATFDKATSGSVLLKGQDLSKLKDKDLADFRRDNLGFVFQDFNLLDNFSVKDNILLPLVLANKNYKDMEKRLEKVIKPLGIEKLIDKYPYEISGGQKQRLTIARAMLRKPAVLILDDSTSAVDTATDSKIREAFFNHLPDTTVIIIAQRISSIQGADNILVLDDGKVNGLGTHEELMETNDLYRDIYETQMKGAKGDE